MSQSPSCLTSADCVALAEKLQDVAQALLSIATAQTPNISRELPSNTPLLDIPSEVPPNIPVSTNASEARPLGIGEVRLFDSGDMPSFGTGEVRSVDSGDIPSLGTDGACSLDSDEQVCSFGAGEVRSFFFPAPAIQLEKELLSKHQVSNFQGLLEEVNHQLIGLVKLMQSVHKDTRFRGYIIASLGSQISHSSALLLRMHTIYDKVALVQIDKKQAPQRASSKS